MSIGLSEEGWQLFDEVEAFVRRAKTVVQKITVKELIDKGGINPYMTKALGMGTIYETVDFFVRRRVERSLGTSFGSTLDHSIRILMGGQEGRVLAAAQGQWIAWWDIVLLGPRIVISVKSGPSDMNNDQIDKFMREAAKAKKNQFEPYLAFVYGKQPFSLTKNCLIKKGFNVANNLLVGKAIFTRFIPGPIGYKETLAILGLMKGGIGIIRADMQQRITYLATLLGQTYSTLDDMLDAMF